MKSDSDLECPFRFDGKCIHDDQICKLKSLEERLACSREKYTPEEPTPTSETSIAESRQKLRELGLNI